MSPRPSSFDLATLLELRRDPPRAGQWASEVRQAYFGAHAALRTVPERPHPEADVALERAGEVIALTGLPERDAWRAGDHYMIAIEPGDDAAATRYAEWLLGLADDLPLGCSIAPWSRGVGATARLWAIAVARLILPRHVRVEARHDLVGIRLAQVALAFGADTLAGPIAADRKLPVAGVTRPSEATLAGLRNLIEQAGLEPHEP
ncbi:hypothetical protein ACNOYE_40235 [Nannocystaceae bacterium ST9]